MLQTSFYEANIAMMLKLDNGTTKGKNCSLMSLMNIDVKILNKNTCKQIQENIKMIIHHNQIGFRPRCKNGSTYANQ